MRMVEKGIQQQGVGGLSLGFTNPVGTGGVLDMCVLWLQWCRWVVGIGLWSGGVGGVMSV